MAARAVTDKYKGRPVRPAPESVAERRFVLEARKLGCKTRKLNGAGNRDWPDQLILVPGGARLLIEFKRVGKGLRPTQAAFHTDAYALGHYIYTLDNWQDALEVVKNTRRPAW